VTNSFFKENQKSVIALLETANGMGLLAGPSLGTVLYEYFSFKGPFVFQSMALFLYSSSYRVDLNVLINKEGYTSSG